MSAVIDNRTGQFSEQSLPWYRYGWPWFLISIPLVSIMLGCMMLYLAMQTNNSLVVDDYYKQGKGINLRIERDREASLLGLSAVFTPSAEGLIIQVNQQIPESLPEGLEVKAAALQQAFSLPPVLMVRWIHVMQAENDGQVEVQSIGGGRYIAPQVTLPDNGMFRLHIQPGADASWRLVSQLQGFASEQAIRVDALDVEQVFTSNFLM